MKKSLLLILSSIMLLSLIACNVEPFDSHSHKYISDGGYAVKEDKLYIVKLCNCGDEELTLVENGVIATPSTAQEVLDKVINNQIVYFVDGEYGRLELRQNKYTSKAYATSDSEFANEIKISELNNTGNYMYTRSIENVRLIAAENVVFNDTFDCGTGHFYSASELTSYDPVREIECIGTTTSFYSYLYIKNISFENIKFDFTTDIARKEKDWISFDFNQPGTYFKDLTFKGCSFKGFKTDLTGPAVRLRSELIDTYSNLVVDSCTFDTGYQGVYCQHYTNVTVRNSSFKNFGHNAVAIQSSDNSSFEGEISILNNTFEETADRPLRMNYGTDATILVSENKFEKAVDTDGEVLKITSLDSNSTFSFKSNSYGEIMLDDVEKTGDNTSIVIRKD